MFFWSWSCETLRQELNLSAASKSHLVLLLAFLLRGLQGSFLETLELPRVALVLPRMTPTPLFASPFDGEMRSQVRSGVLVQ